MGTRRLYSSSPPEKCSWLAATVVVAVAVLAVAVVVVVGVLLVGMLEMGVELATGSV